MILKVKKNHVVECLLCGRALVSQKTKSFTLRYIIGFLSFALPQQIEFYLHEDFGMAFLIGFLHALTAFGLVSLYLYANTKFILGRHPVFDYQKFIFLAALTLFVLLVAAFLEIFVSFSR